MTTQFKPPKPFYTTPFRFLSLPPEIRNMIYRHVASVTTRTGIMTFDEELRLLDSLGVHITKQFESRYFRQWRDTPFEEVMRYNPEIFLLCHQVGAEFMASQAWERQIDLRNVGVSGRRGEDLQGHPGPF